MRSALALLRLRSVFMLLVGVLFASVLVPGVARADDGDGGGDEGSDGGSDYGYVEEDYWDAGWDEQDITDDERPDEEASAGSDRCMVNTGTIQIYLPTTTGEKFDSKLKKKLSQSDYTAGRGWKVAEISLRQVATYNTSKVTKTEATVSPFVSATAGAVGAAVTVNEKTNFIEGVNGRSQVNANFKLTSPFGAWNPNYNYTISILSRPNGTASISPSANDPERGLYVSSRASSC